MSERRGVNGFRIGGKVLRGVGFLTGILSAVGLIVAAALPWAQLTVLQAPIKIPGVVTGVGSITAAIGVLVLAQFGIWRRFPLLGILFGAVACYIGMRAEAESGIIVRKYLLETQYRLLPINRRLTQVGLPPIEPTGSGIASRREYTGIGTTYTAWAGVGVITGSLFLCAAEFMLRTCPNCRRIWNSKRGEDVIFCPACGYTVTPEPICPHCAAAVLRGEKYCATCGEKLPTAGNKVKTTKVV